MVTTKVELKRVKVARYLSEETTAFAAQLWVDGEYIADVSNDGHGGNNRIMYRKGQAKGQAFEVWCKAQPPRVSEYGSLDMDADYYITLMLEDYEEEQQVKRWCKTKTVIRLEGDKLGDFHTYKRAYDPEFAQRLRDTEPTLLEIVNERYL